MKAEKAREALLQGSWVLLCGCGESWELQWVGRFSGARGWAKFHLGICSDSSEKHSSWCQSDRWDESVLEEPVWIKGQEGKFMPAEKLHKGEKTCWTFLFWIQGRETAEVQAHEWRTSEEYTRKEMRCFVCWPACIALGKFGRLHGALHLCVIVGGTFHLVSQGIFKIQCSEKLLCNFDHRFVVIAHHCFFRKTVKSPVLISYFLTQT